MSQPDVSELQSIQPADGDNVPDSFDRTALVVDLDGTLLRTDTLYECYFASIANGVPHHRAVLRALLQGKAPLKAYLAETAELDCELLPINDEVFEFARAARANGQPVFLATASNRKLAEQIAARTGIFDGVFASDATINLGGAAKAKQRRTARHRHCFLSRRSNLDTGMAHQQ